MLIATGLQSLLPFISKAVIDIGIFTRDISFIQLMLSGNVVLLLSVTLSNVLRDWVLLHVSTRVNISLISDYLIKLMKLPVTLNKDEIVTYEYEVDKNRRSIDRCLSQFIPSGYCPDKCYNTVSRLGYKNRSFLFPNNHFPCLLTNNCSFGIGCNSIKINPGNITRIIPYNLFSAA